MRFKGEHVVEQGAPYIFILYDIAEAVLKIKYFRSMFSQEVCKLVVVFDGSFQPDDFVDEEFVLVFNGDASELFSGSVQKDLSELACFGDDVHAFTFSHVRFTPFAYDVFVGI